MLVVQPIFSGTTGKISGRVTSKETGEPLIGANVMGTGEGGKEERKKHKKHAKTATQKLITY